MPAWTPERVKALRNRLGYTQEEMAHELGVSVASITRWERGIKAPSRLAERALTQMDQQHNANE